MTLTFRPKPGTVLMCDFDTGLPSPEMIKTRPVVTISPRRRTGPPLCTVIPLSTTRPMPIEPHHHYLAPGSLPGRLADQRNWAKCDMLYTVSLSRLDRVRTGGSRGQPRYIAQIVSDADWYAIQRCVAIALALDMPR